MKSWRRSRLAQLAITLLAAAVVAGVVRLACRPVALVPVVRPGPPMHGSPGHRYDPARCPYCRDDRETIPGLKGQPDGHETDVRGTVTTPAGLRQDPDGTIHYPDGTVQRPP